MSKIPKGTWVEVERSLAVQDRPGLPGGSRPGDPARLPAQLIRVSGFLLEDAELGQQVRIRTSFGKFHTGKLRIQSPSYGHSFGHAAPEARPVRPGGTF